MAPTLSPLILPSPSSSFKSHSLPAPSSAPAGRSTFRRSHRRAPTPRITVLTRSGANSPASSEKRLQDLVISEGSETGSVVSGTGTSVSGENIEEEDGEGEESDKLGELRSERAGHGINSQLSRDSISINNNSNRRVNLSTLNRRTHRPALSLASTTSTASPFITPYNTLPFQPLQATPNLFLPVTIPTPTATSSLQSQLNSLRLAQNELAKKLGVNGGLGFEPSLSLGVVGGDPLVTPRASTFTFTSPNPVLSAQLPPNLPGQARRDGHRRVTSEAISHKPPASASIGGGMPSLDQIGEWIKEREKDKNRRSVGGEGFSGDVHEEASKEVEHESQSQQSIDLKTSEEDQSHSETHDSLKHLSTGRKELLERLKSRRSFSPPMSAGPAVSGFSLKSTLPPSQSPNTVSVAGGKDKPLPSLPPTVLEVDEKVNSTIENLKEKNVEDKDREKAGKRMLETLGGRRSRLSLPPLDSGMKIRIEGV